MIFVDIFIIIMLVITIVFCIKLNSKIELVQQGKKEFAILFKNFDSTIQKAEKSIVAFQQAAKNSGYELDNKNKLAQQLIDELAFVIEKANKTIDLLKQGYTPAPVQQNMRTNIQYNNEIIANKEDQDFIRTSNKIIANNDQPQKDVVIETKRLAIEELLNKISEIQKKAGNN